LVYSNIPAFFLIRKRAKNQGHIGILPFFKKKEAKKTAAVVGKAKNHCLRLKKNKSQLKNIAGLR